MPEGKKRIIVDGASFVNSLRVIGVDHTNYQGVMHVLRYEVGSCCDLDRAVITVHPKFCRDHKQPDGVYRDVLAAGWEVKKTESWQGDDDESVMRAVDSCLDSSALHEIVLATSDGRIIENFIWTIGEGRKRGREVRGIVFATCVPDEDGTCRICNSVLSQLQNTTYMEFCEMLPFRHILAAEAEHFHRHHR